MSDSSDSKREIENASAVWRVAERVRERGMDLSSLLAALEQEGLSTSWRDVARLSGRGMWDYLPTEPAIDLLAALVGANRSYRLLDPWAGAGILLAGLAEVIGAESCSGLVNRPDLKLVAEHLLPDAVWRVGDSLAELVALREQESQFDVIVSAPPWGLRPHDATDAFGRDKRISRLSLDQQLVLASCSLLSDSGRAFFILPNAFLMKGSTGIRALLEERGFHIWSVIALPPSWNPATSLGGNVIEIRPVPVKEIFVARASPGSPNTALLTNFSERRRGKAPELGSLVDLDSFSTWEAFENGLAFEAAAKAFGTSVAELATIVVAKFLGNRTTDGGFQDYPNAVFFPTLGTSPAVTSRARLSIKPHNYIQLVLNPDLADAEYVARYLNTPLGALTRQTVYTGAFIKKASLGSIGFAPIVLPPIESQTRMVGLQQRVDDLRVKLGRAEHDLWRTRDGARSARRALQGFPTDDTTESWVQRLPFPLPSILWHYRATRDARRKIEILFAFFEATAQFVTTILLSGLRSDPVIYGTLKRGSLSEIEGARWREVTLGFWVVIGTNLAKAVRQMLSEDQRLLCRDLFRCSGDWLDAMAGKELFGALEQVSGRRNAWKAHGGIESDVEMMHRLDRLQSDLTSLFTPLTWAFEDLTLIRPKSLQYDGQLYEVEGEELVGPTVPFRETTRQVVRPMRRDALFLLERDARDGLELLPFIQMRVGTLRRLPRATSTVGSAKRGPDSSRITKRRTLSLSRRT